MGFVGRLLIRIPNYTAATATACMVYVQWYSLYVRRGSVIAGEFKRWKLTVTAADSIAMCDACTPYFLVFMFSAVCHFSANVSYSWAFIFHDAKAEILSEKYSGWTSMVWLRWALITILRFTQKKSWINWPKRSVVWTSTLRPRIERESAKARKWWRIKCESWRCESDCESVYKTRKCESLRSLSCENLRYNLWCGRQIG